jgi:methylmalonyl-CoA carboxyltransferase large subunit
METVTNNSHAVMEAVESLRREVARLGERMSQIEERIHGSADKIGPTEKSPTAKEEFNEELLIAISAAVAAYLGVKPHIRQIRLLSSVPWSHEGRVTIQASRDFAVHHS